LLGLIYFGSTAAFNSFTGVATICLSCGYGLPILVSVLRRRELLRGSTFSLGRFGYTINIVCLVWIVLAVVLFCMPVRYVVDPQNLTNRSSAVNKLTQQNHSLPVTAETMNYASVVFAGFASISLGWYFISGRKHFRGPPVPVDVSNTVKGQSLENVDSGEADVGMPMKGEKKMAI
jgi:amino acid transporter